MKATRICLSAVTVLLLAAHAGAQGLYFESESSAGGKDMYWYMPGKFKTASKDGKTMIVRLDKETIYQINPSTKTYTQATFAELKQMADAGFSMMDEMMKKRMESLPPEKRKEYEDQMAAAKQSLQGEVKYEVKSSGESKTISGYSCSKYVVNRNGKEFETIWATKDLGNMESVHKDMEQLSQKMASLVKARSTPLSWFKEIPGFPIENDQHGMVHTVTHVEKQSVKDSEFEVPSGYTKKDMNMMGGSGE